MRKLGICLFALILAVPAFANTPGKKTVNLTWAAGANDASFNIYRGTAAGVCNGTPTPYVTGVSQPSYADSNVTGGTTYFYNVSGVNATGESACDGEISVTVPNITAASPSGLSGSVN